MGFYNLQSLNSRLSSLESSLSSYESQLRTQKKRREDIKEIIRNMRVVCNSDSSNITLLLNCMIQRYEPALVGVSSVGSLISTTTSDKEKGLSEDSNMNNAHSTLVSELKIVEAKISELESKIRHTRSQIASCKNSIRSEKHNIASGYREEYFYSKSRVDSLDRARRENPTSAQIEYQYYQACQQRDSARNNYYKYYAWL